MKYYNNLEITPAFDIYKEVDILKCDSTFITSDELVGSTIGWSQEYESFYIAWKDAWFNEVVDQIIEAWAARGSRKSAKVLLAFPSSELVNHDYMIGHLRYVLNKRVDNLKINSKGLVTQAPPKRLHANEVKRSIFESIQSILRQRIEFAFSWGSSNDIEGILYSLKYNKYVKMSYTTLKKLVIEQLSESRLYDDHHNQILTKLKELWESI